MIKAVLFDLGGTLHVCRNSPERALRFASRLLERLGDYGIELNTTAEEFSAKLQINAEVYKAEVEKTQREMKPVEAWRDYFLKGYDIDPELLAYIAEELSFLYDYDRPSNLRRPNLISTMEQLKDMGIRLGVISNILSVSIVPHFMAEYGLEKYMECVITSAGTGIRKPDAGIFRIAEDVMGLKPEEFAYVGDTISRDVRGVRNAGWHTMIQIFSPASLKRDKCMQGLGYAPDYTISDLSEIPEIIKRENAK